MGVIDKEMRILHWKTRVESAITVRLQVLLGERGRKRYIRFLCLSVVCYLLSCKFCIVSEVEVDLVGS